MCELFSCVFSTPLWIIMWLFLLFTFLMLATAAADRDREKVPVKHKPGLISLDDLLIEKLGVHQPDTSRETNLYCRKTAGVQIFSTPVCPLRSSSAYVPSATPRTGLHRERVIQPSKFLLPPYCSVTSTKQQNAVYQNVIIEGVKAKRVSF